MANLALPKSGNFAAFVEKFPDFQLPLLGDALRGDFGNGLFFRLHGISGGDGGKIGQVNSFRRPPPAWGSGERSFAVIEEALQATPIFSARIFRPP